MTAKFTQKGCHWGEEKAPPSFEVERIILKHEKGEVGIR